MTYEEWHAFIAAHLPDPVSVEDGDDDETWFRAGDPGEVLVRLRAHGVAVFEFTVRSANGRGRIRPRLIGLLRPAGIDDSRAMAIVEGLIAAARERRLGSYRACRVCTKRLPPEDMRGSTCPQCTDEASGTVH